MWLTDGFFAHFLWKVEGTVRIHVNSCVAHVWLSCRMVGEGGGGHSELLKTQKVQKTSNFYKGGGEH